MVLNQDFMLKIPGNRLESLKINGGLRFSHFLASKNQYHFFEPRISVAWRLQNDFAIKGFICIYESVYSYDIRNRDQSSDRSVGSYYRQGKTPAIEAVGPWSCKGYQQILIFPFP